MQESPVEKGDVEATETKVQLASVRLLLETDRTVDIADIMLATIFEELEAGPKSSEKLFDRVRRAWPGVAITRSMLDATLEAAREHNLVEVIVPLGGGSSWGLANVGRDELELSKDWANDVMERTAAHIHLDARSYFAQMNAEMAIRWTAILFNTLMWGIATTFTEGEGGITLIDDRFLFPETYDLAAMDSKLEKNCKDPEVLAFLKSELRAALDPSNDFATELVHYVATGYVLYSYLGHRDHHDERVSVGTFNDEVVLLDTPFLIQLLSDQNSGRAAVEILKIAIQQGVKVTVDPSTIVELNNAVDSRSGEASDVEKGVREGADLNTLRSTINDQILSAWLRSLTSWTEFQRRAASIESILTDLSVECSGSTHWTQEMAEEQKVVKSGLEVALAERGNSRGDVQLDHDARLLTIAKKERALNPESASKIWPGAVIITTDTHMNSAYTGVFGPQKFPVALTASQWAGLLGCFSPPVNAERLAFALTEGIPARTILKGAIQIPTATAIELARSFSGTDASQSSMKDLQMSLQDLLQSVPNPFAMTEDAARDLARQALAQHVQRTTRVSKELIETSRTAYEKQFEALDRETELVRSQGGNGELQSLREKNIRLGRALRVASIVFVAAITIVVLRFQNLEPGHKFGVAFACLAIFIGAGIDYSIHVERKWYEPVGGLIVAIAIAVLTISL